MKGSTVHHPSGVGLLTNAAKTHRDQSCLQLSVSLWSNDPVSRPHLLLRNNVCKDKNKVVIDVRPFKGETNILSPDVRK